MRNVPPDSILAGKVDYDNIGIIGYSLGGAGAICAVTNFKNGTRYKAMFTGSAAYPTLAGNMGWEYDVAKVTCAVFWTIQYTVHQMSTKGRLEKRPLIALRSLSTVTQRNVP